MLTRLSLRVIALWTLLGFLGVLAVSVLVEHLLEKKDKIRLAANEVFCAVGGRRVRYHLLGASRPGPTLVLVPAIFAYIEQWDDVQRALSQVAPVFVYDRAGMGFTDDDPKAHDAEGEANELLAVLRATGSVPPFVIVGYSSSALVARVFAAQHPDLVKGLVFIDPVVPEARRSKTFRRTFGRMALTMTAKALVGELRVRRWLEDRHDPAMTPSRERERAILISGRSWFAVTEDVFGLDRSAKQALAAHGFGTMPVGVLGARDPGESEESRDGYLEQQALAARSVRGTFRNLIHVDHTKLLSDEVALEAVVDLVRKIEDEAR